MSDSKTIKKAYERNRKAIEMRPSVGQSTALTKVKIRDGTTCEIESGSKTLVCDIGEAEGGNDAGPGPGIFERAALGSCLAMGYAQQAAVMEIPVDHIEVFVESDFDARGQFGLTDDPPGFKALRYEVRIESPAPEVQIIKMINRADARSPVLDDFKRPIPIERKVNIESTRAEPS
ncbi:OsmC family protein [Fodinibius sediminis]|uniref:Uncharacterized OsmC-related protein n=1 Tax=Fodinibius sediminis TaxID=1214077 RepID=A0A521ARG8_9BACT|nr:OsmC family protein [Fodinibius sediminis]SMO37418.1 Uncharacterized OsmC-related protein [Fodinibius sediminis]